MSKVNFVSEFNMFMRYARDNSLSLRERMLWIALFYIANDRANYNEQTQEYEWPDDFIQVSNNELNLYCCLDKRAVETLRNTLKQRGLIDFQPGLKNKRNPAYKIFYLSVNVGYKKVPNSPPNIAPNDDPSNVPNDAPNIVPNFAPSVSPLYKYNIDSGVDSAADDSVDEDDEDDDRMRVHEEIKTAYRQAFGQNPTATELGEMTRLVTMMNLSQVAWRLVIETAKAAPSNRLAYFRTLCTDWNSLHIRTLEELQDHQVLQSLMRSYPEEAAEYGNKMLEGARARREKYARPEVLA